MRRRRGRQILWCSVAGLALAAGVTSPVGATKTKPASGAPILVAFENLDATSSTLPARQGAQAAVKSLNASGGIGGRPIELTECLTDLTPEKGKTCMDAAATAKVAAVLSVQPGSAADSLPSLTAAAIPYVGQTCNTNATLSGQFPTFCFGSDFVGLYSSSANYLKSLTTVKKAALAYISVPAAVSGVKAYAVPIFQKAGITPIEVPIAEGTPDINTVLTPALQTNPDALVGLLTGPGCITTMKTMAAETAPKPLVLPALCTDPDVTHDSGSSAKGTLFVRQTLANDPKNADVKTYEKALAKFAKNADPGDLFTQAGFAAVMNLASALRQIPAGSTIDGASTTAALKAAKAVPLFLGGGATYTCDGTAFTGLKALCSLQSHVVQYEGKNKWIDKGIF